jgi:hypothetical protein
MKHQSKAHLKDAQPSTPSAKVQKSISRATGRGSGSNIESAAMQLIKGGGEKGVLQSRLLEKLGVTSRKGLRLVSRLESLGLVTKSKELYGGKWTYRLVSPTEKALNIRWDDLGCPCFFCGDGGRCGLGNIVSPSSCLPLSQWIRSSLPQEEKPPQDGS